jgi:hypothetical protein
VATGAGAPSFASKVFLFAIEDSEPGRISNAFID